MIEDHVKANQKPQGKADCQAINLSLSRYQRAAGKNIFSLFSFSLCAIYSAPFGQQDRKSQQAKIVANII
jgi:hypothetical protein